jgi:asparagine synthetase B (glutamine-hydrolysing)
MFATAIWDGRRERLVILRDRIGIKPVYYTRLPDGTLVFGSELKAILAHPRVPRELEPRALDLYLTVEYIPAPWTIFKRIFKLPPTYLTYDGGRVMIALLDVGPTRRGQTPRAAVLRETRWTNSMRSSRSPSGSASSAMSRSGRSSAEASTRRPSSA